MDEDIILQVEHLRKHFGGVTAISDISFDLRRGEFLGLIGPNGSGKTTLVNLITGFIRPDAGRVLYNGKDITAKMPYTIAGMGIARTFQMVRLFYNLAAYKNIIIPLCSPRVRRRRGGKYGERDDMAVEILDEFGFERNSYVPYKAAGSLPHGYLKRLDLARAMALRPDLLLLDELFSGMSMSEVAATLPMLEKLSEEGLSIIMVEHRLKELFRVAGRVMVLNFGQKIAEGPPETVMKSEAVASAYLGSEAEVSEPPPAKAPSTVAREGAGEGAEQEGILRVDRLTVYFENALALNDVSLRIGEGEMVGILGSNSAGKTTLMNAVSGLILDMKKKEDRRGGERISIYGDVFFKGKKISGLGPVQRVRQGLVLCRERHPVFRDSDVVENLRIAGSQHRGHDIKKSIALVFDIFPHLKRLHTRKSGLLSGGEQQMLSIGMTLVTRPELLLLDEPLLGLSPLLQSHLAQAMKEICQRGVTLVVTEQFARPLLPVIHRGYVISNGILMMEGSRQELADNPEVRASYLGV